MPTYDYVCDACGHAFEAFQSMSASSMRKCPECGRLKLKRLIGTGAGVIFKGSGFYETDYRSDEYKKAAKADKEGGDKSKDDKAKSKEGGDAGTKSDTATKAKPEKKKDRASDTDKGKKTKKPQ